MRGSLLSCGMLFLISSKERVDESIKVGSFVWGNRGVIVEADMPRGRANKHTNTGLVGGPSKQLQVHTIQH